MKSQRAFLHLLFQGFAAVSAGIALRLKCPRAKGVNRAFECQRICYARHSSAQSLYLDY